MICCVDFLGGYVKFRLIALIIIMGCLFLAITAVAEVTQYYFKFQVSSKDQVDKLTNIISIDNVDGLTVYAYANGEEFENFKKLGYRYEILPSPGTLIIPDMAEPGEIITDWDTYPTYSGYVAMMNQFAATYPNLCQIVNIGSSVNGHALLFAKISDNVGVQENEPEVMYSSTMHGDEATGYVLMLRLIDYLLSNYATDPQVANLVNGLEIWINPLANPDGSYYGGDNTIYGAIRYNANGADLNRNFPDPAEGDHPDGRAWQPETIAMMNFFAAHNFVISANFHGGAEVVNYPWDTWVRRHADDSWFIDISRAYAESCQAHSPSGYMTDLNDGITNGYDWYRVSGGRQDYIIYFKGGREVTIEISQTKLLPANQLPAFWNYNRISFLNFLENAFYGVRGLVTDATSGLPLPAKISVLSHDIDSADVHTDPDVGDYHRMIDTGTYTFEFSSPGYVTQTVSGVNVAERSTTILNIQLQPLSSDPVLSFYGHDAGAVDPGDAVSMHITLVNDGGGAANGVTGILSSDDPFVNITGNSSAYPSIPALGGRGTSISQYAFAVLPSCPILHDITFRLDITASGGYIDTAFFAITVGRQIEDFESGNFASYPWLMGGNANWIITSLAPYEGIYSAVSGDVTHNQSSQLSVQVSIAAAGTISFYRKVSSEDNYDYLRFFIDNVLQDEWSGELAWTVVAFNVSAGTHTFKWGYYKDGSVSEGSDCGWIDYIVFPPMGQPLQITTLTLPNWTVSIPYSFQLQASGGIGEKTWSDFNNGLSGTGLGLSSAGLVSGTPGVIGAMNFTARVQDEIGGSAQRPFAFAINPQPQVSTTSLPSGNVGIPYTCQLQSTGGTGILIWSDRDGDLGGSGLALSQSGLLSGTPLVSGELGFTAVVTDSVGAIGQRDLVLSVTSPGSYIPGDVNNSGQTNGIDVTFFVTYLKGGEAPPFSVDCPPHGVIYAAGDVNGSCSVNGVDVTYLVAFFKGLQTTLVPCADCPPGPAPASGLPHGDEFRGK